MRFILTGGQAHDAPLAPDLLKDLVTEQVLADKSYDSNSILKLIQEMLNAEAVIPPKSNRLEPHDYDKDAYKERHLIECFINKQDLRNLDESHVKNGRTKLLFNVIIQ